MNNKSASDSLFHFTERFENLKGILKTGFIPFFCEEDTGWLNYPRLSVSFTPMCCFCDIPIGRLQNHVGYYMKYGIGMSRDWAIANELNPLLYISSKSQLLPYIQSVLIPSLIDLCENEGDAQRLKYILSFIKPARGTSKKSDVEMDFTQEREWRYVPDCGAFPLTQEEYMDKKDEYDNHSRNAPLKFEPSDIRYIFVEHETEIRELIDFIHSTYGTLQKSDLQLLTSRIMSVEQLANDF